MRGPVGDYFHDGHGVSDQQHIGEKVQTTGLTDAAVDQLGVVAAALRRVTIRLPGKTSKGNVSGESHQACNLECM